MKTVEHWIGGASTPGSSDRTAEVYKPATGQVQARVLLAGTADVELAVQTARTRASPRSTSRPWCRCGCTRWPSSPGTRSC